jgi:hypothetical protein
MISAGVSAKRTRNIDFDLTVTSTGANTKTGFFRAGRVVSRRAWTPTTLDLRDASLIGLTGFLAVFALATSWGLASFASTILLGSPNLKVVGSDRGAEVTWAEVTWAEVTRAGIGAFSAHAGS